MCSKVVLLLMQYVPNYDLNTAVNLQVEVFPFSAILHFENSPPQEVKWFLGSIRHLRFCSCWEVKFEITLLMELAEHNFQHSVETPHISLLISNIPPCIGLSYVNYPVKH